MFVENYADGDTVVAEPTLAGYVAWLETQDPNATYDWWSYDDCPAGRYAKAIGLRNRRDWWSGDSWIEKVKPFSMIAHPRGPEGSLSDDRLPASDYIQTFGQCLERARKALAAA